METGSFFGKCEKHIAKKIKQYTKLEGWFHVIFCTMDYPSSESPKVCTRQAYAKRIMDCLWDYEETKKVRLGTRFLITTQQEFLQYTTLAVLTHHHDKKFSLDNLPLQGKPIK
jgi:hypothetical protein